VALAVDPGLEQVQVGSGDGEHVEELILSWSRGG
jgi:hypothetical protein